MELLLIRDHPTHINHPEREAKQAIVAVNDKYAISMIWAKGSRWDHGFYCEDGQCEIALLVLLTNPSQLAWDEATNPQYEIARHGLSMIEPKGWVKEDDVEYWINRVRTMGVAGWEDEESGDDE